MRRPCWHFLQAGHSFTSSMRHPLHPIQRPLSALHAGPGLPGPEHLPEVVDAIEVLRPVTRLPRQEADLDQHEDDSPEILRLRDAPVLEDRRREQAELLLREVATRPRELGAAQMTARRQLALGILERGQDEQVAALVVAPVLAADPREGFFQRDEVAHGCASVCPDERGRTMRGRAGWGSRSAMSSTSSMVSTGRISSSCFTSSGTSTMSF